MPASGTTRQSTWLQLDSQLMREPALARVRRPTADSAWEALASLYLLMLLTGTKNKCPTYCT